MKKPTNKPMHTSTKKKVARVTKFPLIIGFFRTGTSYQEHLSLTQSQNQKT